MIIKKLSIINLLYSVYTFYNIRDKIHSIINDLYLFLS